MPSTKQNILIIKLGALGDFIQALGPMAAIRRHHKNDKLTLLTTKPFETFAQKCGYFDKILIDKRPRATNIIGWIDLRRTLNAASFERVYDLQNNDRTNLYFKLFKPKPEWVGIAKGASHRNTSPQRSAGHALDGHIQTLALAGIRDIKIDTLDWMDADLSAFEPKQPSALLIPGSAPNHPKKRWPAAYYADLANALSEQNIQPVILGTIAELSVTNHIRKKCPEALDLTAQTSLQQITALARGAGIAIGNDTGPMHLIAATGCSSLVLFSRQSNPLRHGPKGKKVEILQADNLNDLKSETVKEKALSLIA